MKVLIYQGGRNFVKNSGVGMAITHQIESVKNKYDDLDLVLNEKKDYDIIHLNTILPDSYFQSLKAKRKGKKVIYHAHSTEEDFRNSFVGSNVLSKLFKFWICKCYNTADEIITPSEYSKQLIENYGIKKPIYVLSNGIDTNYYRRKDEDRKKFLKKYGFKNEDKIIISVGLPIERKGILDFAKLAQRMPEYKFVWFGDIDMSMLPNKIKKVLNSNIPNLYFPGFAKKEELRQAYGAADLFLFLTKEETEGIVLLEAMSMETPILIRDIPVFNWLKDRENVIKGKNMSDFENEIKEIVVNKDDRIIRNARKLIMQKDIKNVGKNLYNIYSKANNMEKDMYENRKINLDFIKMRLKNI